MQGKDKLRQTSGALPGRLFQRLMRNGPSVDFDTLGSASWAFGTVIDRIQCDRRLIKSVHIICMQICKRKNENISELRQI